MHLPIFQLDAFSDRVFRGNSAAVCPLDRWLDDATMQAIALENNLAETAFFVGGQGRYHLRWFTPAVEVDLCGHATLAAAEVIFRKLEPQLTGVTFDSRSGPLPVKRTGERLQLDFPARPPARAAAPQGLLEALGAVPLEVHVARDFMLVYETATQVRELRPDFARLREVDTFGIIVTAPGDDCDFVSRFFAPCKGVDEDPVTGSSHCTLVPYWSARLGKSELRARQISARGGELWCRAAGPRVFISGQVAWYLEGQIEIPDA